MLRLSFAGPHGVPPSAVQSSVQPSATAFTSAVDKGDVDLYNGLRPAELAEELSAWARRVLPPNDTLCELDATTASALRTIGRVGPWS